MPRGRQQRRRRGLSRLAGHEFLQQIYHSHGHGADHHDVSVSEKTLKVALAGNPNAGKTSLFNAITGHHQHVGNYPGVTVEKKTGIIHQDGISIQIVDLPGTYSLSAYSIEEIVTRDFVLTEKPDLIVDVLDSSNLERNLYLLLQFQELGIPVVGVLNMMDEAEEHGIDINAEQLGRILGIPMVKTVGHRGEGVPELLSLLSKIAKKEYKVSKRRINYGREIESKRDELVELMENDKDFDEKYCSDWMAIKLLEGDGDARRKVRDDHKENYEVLQAADEAVEWINKHFKEESPVVVAEQRYAYIHGAIRETVTTTFPKRRINVTEVIDRVVLNRFAGIFIFFGMMFLIYQLTFALGNPLSDLIDRGFASLGDLLSTIMPEGIFRDLVVDGIVGGVGGVLVFFPLVLLLFMGLAFLEDTGYMARAAFVMDRFFHLFGLHGRSFVPFMIATGCAVPAVMSARTLVNPRDRIITIMVTPMMMCGAKSPVIAMLSAAFFPAHAATVFWLVWLAGWMIAFFAALVLRKTVFKGEAAPFVMELPPYRLPTVQSILHHMWERSAMYIRKAGTFILAASIVIWFMLNFPHYNNAELAQVAQNDARLSHYVENGSIEHLNASNMQTLKIEATYAGRLGRWAEPALHPLGFDYRIGAALFAGVAAKEVIVSTLGIVYGVGETDPDLEAGGKRTPLKERIAHDPAYTPASALSLMFFVLIYIPCVATLAVVHKELGGWRWPSFLALYTLVLAWVVAFLAYQISALAGLA